MPTKKTEKKVLLELPAKLAEAVKRMLEVDELGARMADGREPIDSHRFSAAAEAAMASAELELERRRLQRLDEKARVIEVGGKKYRRVGRHEGTYYAKAGPVMLMRTLYRDAAVRNDKTVDAISLKLGCIEDGWLPEAADAMGYLLQNMPGTEAEKVSEKVGRLPYSASSFKRVGGAVGNLYELHRSDVEDVLIAECVIPDKAQSLTVSLDRVAVPMEEDVPRKAGRPRKGAPKKSITRAFRMAWVGTVTMNDVEGEALYTIRYGQMPTSHPEQLLESMAGDVRALLAKRPGLKVVALCDGGAEVVEFLDQRFTEKLLGVPVTRLVDFWQA